jgi:hypothetical protein
VFALEKSDRRNGAYSFPKDELLEWTVQRCEKFIWFSPNCSVGVVGVRIMGDEMMDE